MLYAEGCGQCLARTFSPQSPGPLPCNSCQGCKAKKNLDGHFLTRSSFQNSQSAAIKSQRKINIIMHALRLERWRNSRRCCYNKLYSHDVRTHSSGFLWQLLSAPKDFPIKLPIRERKQMPCVQRKPEHTALSCHQLFSFSGGLAYWGQPKVEERVPICAAEREWFPLTVRHLLSPVNSYSYFLTVRGKSPGAPLFQHHVKKKKRRKKCCEDVF